MNNNPRWMWAALGLLFVAAIAWSARGLSWTEEEVSVGASGPARRNPWYAAELLLSARGVPAESSEALTDLPPTDHVILWMARQPSSEPLGRLEGWVRSGGHLIAALPLGSALEAHKLRQVEVDTASPPEDEAPVEEQAEQAADEEAADEEVSDTGDAAPPPLQLGDVAPVELDDPVLALTGAGAFAVGLELGNQASLVPPQGGDRLSIEGLPWLRLTPLGAARLWPTPDPEGPGGTFTPILRVKVDQGWVTLLVSSRPFNNAHLGEADHAALLLSLVQREGVAGARLIVSAEPPSIWALLASHAWPALLSGGALLGLWLWATLPGFGPLLPDPSPHRRSLVEHVIATGQLLWRLDRGDVLLRSARRAALREAAGVSDLPVGPVASSVIEAVSAETGLSADALREALRPGDTDPDSFLRSAAALAALRATKRPPNPGHAA